MKRYFEGFYFKQHTAGHTLALIPGVSNDSAFIQVITDGGSYNITYPRREYRRGRHIRVGGSIFSHEGIILNITAPDIRLTGGLSYSNLTPIKGNIMGPFKILPMECRHSIISMRHSVTGKITLNGKAIDFRSGLGYIEADSGRSFPKNYSWVQSNDFDINCSIMASAAQIPFAGINFFGCICIVWLNGREYRLATYLGAEILRCEKGALILSQGKYRLEAYVDVQPGHALLAPHSGVMNRTIHESVSCPAYFRFSRNNEILFEGASKRASYEFSAQKANGGVKSPPSP